MRVAQRADRARVTGGKVGGDEEDEIDELRDVVGGAAARDEAGAAWPGRSLSTLLAALRQHRLRPRDLCRRRPCPRHDNAWEGIDRIRGPTDIWVVCVRAAAPTR